MEIDMFSIFRRQIDDRTWKWFELDRVKYMLRITPGCFTVWILFFSYKSKGQEERSNNFKGQGDPLYPQVCYICSCLYDNQVKLSIK